MAKKNKKEADINIVSGIKQEEDVSQNTNEKVEVKAEPENKDGTIEKMPTSDLSLSNAIYIESLDIANLYFYSSCIKLVCDKYEHLQHLSSGGANSMMNNEYERNKNAYIYYRGLYDKVINAIENKLRNLE